MKAPISKGKKKSNAVDVNPNPKKRKNARPARAPARRACMVVNYKEVVDEDDGASDGDASMDQEDEVEGEDEEDEAMSLEDEEEEAFAKRKGKATANADSKRKPKGKGSAFVKKLTDEEQAALPVLTNPYDMFLDMVGNTPEIADVVKQLQGRPIRVATMCSGTESPLLALDMISRAVQERYNSKLEVEHVFSCEIEPFKQAYIERNFQPPKLFRDVRELCNKFATTAYGALLPVPGDVDILVAGTSCVDYSNLNNERKGLDDGGESGQTFKGMMEWIKRAKPPVVILENVCNAPWEAVAERFRDNGYHATYQRLDTKQYYIPHTRTRVYLFATLIDKFGKADVSEQWKEMVKHLQRPSSATLEAFLLPVDDPRVHRAREDLGSTVRENRKVTDWGRCESRHQRARAEEGLGNKRPLTGWEEGGNCKLVEYAWHDWGSTQVDRVLDLMDINALRLGATGVDATQKCMVWNLSQNVDRTTGSNKPGICPCLTPSMVPYVTNRGGPLVGIEALSLQGIPVDDLLLTRESEDQMADLAGNAMTSTVVGACMLSALILGNHSLLAHQCVLATARRITPKLPLSYLKAWLASHSHARNRAACVYSSDVHVELAPRRLTTIATNTGGRCPKQ
jgi:site-specific DNA-cytosine methylase